MTSEVLMLNKDAVLIAADSAVTTGRNPHPRYSKAANKIFDLSVHGNVAVMIYSTSEIDRVPWELALKQFRHHDAINPPRAALKEYIGALVAYLEGNLKLFPAPVQHDLLQKRIILAAINVLERVEGRFPSFIDTNAAAAARVAAWASGYAALSLELTSLPYQAPITPADYQVMSAQSGAIATELGPLIAGDLKYAHADVLQLTQLAIDTLAKRPTEFLNSTGLVIAGYGSDEIFPNFFHLAVYGHVGARLLWTEVHKYAITHDNDAWIQPFAQSSMIDRFTDGFDAGLNWIIHQGTLESFNGVISDLQGAGIAIPNETSDPIISNRHSAFMTSWKKKNWEANFYPLRRVLNSLSVSEMGHLAESLLVLEALRERVTSPSESVGGPIDVAVITKAEGMLWLKRKHFFDPQLNLRYINRSQTP